MPYLTDDLVERIQPGPRAQFVWDSEVSGFGVKVATSGRKTFVLQWRADPASTASRRRKIARVGEMDAAQARTLAESLKSHLTENVEPQPSAQTAGAAVRSKDALAWLRGDAHFRPDGVRQGRSATKAKIIDAACDAFLEHGYDVSLEVIAEGAAVSTPTIYKHFKSKEDLFKQCVAEYGLRQVPELEMDPSLPLKEVFLLIGRAYQNYILEDRSVAIARLAITDIHRFPDISTRLFDLTMRMFELLVARIELARSNGEIRPVDPVLTAEGFLGAVVGYERTRRLIGLAGDAPEVENRRLTAMVDLFVNGIGR